MPQIPSDLELRPSGAGRRANIPLLLAAAAEGKLTTREEVAEAVQRILDEPRIEKSRVLWFFRDASGST